MYSNYIEKVFPLLLRSIQTTFFGVFLKRRFHQHGRFSQIAYLIQDNSMDSTNLSNTNLSEFYGARGSFLFFKQKSTLLETNNPFCNTKAILGINFLELSNRNTKFLN